MNNVIFLGQKPVGEKAFALLQEADSSSLRVVAVCSNPSPTNVWWATNRIFDERGSLPFISNEINHEQQLMEAIERTDANVIISVQHPHALSNKVLEAVNFKAFNLHSAKLPQYRGFNIANHAILNEEKIYTCTVHWMVPKVDMGDIAFEETFPILDLETAQSLYIKAAQAAIKGFRKLLDSLIEGKEPPRVPLGTGGRFYSRKSIDGLKEIRDIPNLEDMDVRSRAFYFPPFEPAYFWHGSKKVYVLPQGADFGDFPGIQ